MVGDIHVLNATTIVDLRASYLEKYNFQNILSQGFDMSSISPAYLAIQSQSFGASGTLPGLGIRGYGVGAGTSQLYCENTVYGISGSVSKVLTKHTIKAGGNWRQVLWTSYGNNGGLSLDASHIYSASSASDPSQTATRWPCSSVMRPRCMRSLMDRLLN